jgi:hypothetical protein
MIGAASVVRLQEPRRLDISLSDPRGLDQQPLGAERHAVQLGPALAGLDLGCIHACTSIPTWAQCWAARRAAVATVTGGGIEASAQRGH